MDMLSTFVRLPELRPRAGEWVKPLPVLSVAKIVVGALGEFASHNLAKPDSR